MCTAVTYHNGDHYFGRNLDLDYTYNESVTITPRSYSFTFRCERPMPRHYAMIGMSHIDGNYPLYYDATNEAGLSMAGLNFPGNAVYYDPVYGKHNIAPFEFIPWILGQCKNVGEVKVLLADTNLVKIPFSNELPLTPLHWIIADANTSITVESISDGLKVYDNPVGVLTNNPPFDFHLNNLSNYLNLTREEPSNRFSKDWNLSAYSRGMGALGLPGDLSSSSRFIRAAFIKTNSVADKNETASVSQFFHILDSVVQPEGCVRVGNRFEKTVYSSCCNTQTGVYYYTTYGNRQITGVDIHRVQLDTDELFVYPLIHSQKIQMIN